MLKIKQIYQFVASQLGFTPTGNIAATNVQAAIEELDTEAVHLAGTETISGSKSFSNPVNISNTTPSTSTTTGALQVAGGVGIGGTSYTSTVILTGSLSVGSSSAKAQFGSSDASNLTSLSINRNSGNGNLRLSISPVSPIGTNENELRLHQNLSNYLSLIGARGGSISQALNNEFLIQSSVSGAKYPIRFRLLNLTDSTKIDSLILNSTGNILIGEPTEDNTNKLQVNGTVKASQFRLAALNSTPASSTDTGTLGEIRIDSNYIYVCVAPNSWKRTQLSNMLW
ncbi:hypothetical protein [Nostoc sp. FACHB-110]|uniref:hypothetical protein n=1 Tax=Nostoc sp. FACHB-110 TaxID=2692834 RepID=UPI0016891086|nr:hypothetical protein [Nostoc sp. FACHB-110]MBD2437366.1 hypothetical protein [Nostoc sp. FACHB-110]